MWPLDRVWRPTDVVRAGYDRVEIYSRTPTGLVLEGQQPLDAGIAHGSQRLEMALTGLLNHRPTRGGRARLEIVLESAWAPVMLLPAGDRPWSTRPLDALLRHRLSALHGNGDDAAADWELRVDHRAGDRQGLGYALSSSVKDALLRATTEAACALASVQPGFAWGWQHKRRPRLAGLRAWWVWPEQDRSLIAQVVQGKVMTFNPAADVCPAHDHGFWEAAMGVECVRAGSTDDKGDQIVVGGWDCLVAERSGRVLPWSVATAPAKPSAAVSTSLARR